MSENEKMAGNVIMKAKSGGKNERKSRRVWGGKPMERGIGKCGIKEKKEERIGNSVLGACQRWLQGRGLAVSYTEIHERYAREGKQRRDGKLESYEDHIVYDSKGNSIGIRGNKGPT